MSQANALSRIALVLLTCVASIALGVVHQRMTDPRAKADAIEQATKSLAKPFPTELGDWVRDEVGKLDEDSNIMLQCHGSFVGTYTNKNTGAQADVFLLLGPPGPIAVHIPEVCVPKDVYDHTTRKRMPLDRVVKSGDLWDLTFSPKDGARKSFQCVYGWSNGGSWTASESPRFQFASSPYLYKLQVSYSAPPETSEKDGSSLQDFLAQFLPECSARLRSE
jgi:hypothetical protein